MWGAETFELVYPEKKFRLLSEHVRTPSIHACALANKCFSNSSFKAEAGMQVTRTPPVCVIHAEGQRWRFDAENEPHVWFWGASIDLNVRARRPRRMVPLHASQQADAWRQGARADELCTARDVRRRRPVHVHQGDWGPALSGARSRCALLGAAQHAAACVQVKASIGNIIVGKPTVNHFGTFRVENKGTGLAAVMELVKPPLLALSSKSRKLHEVRQGWRPRIRVQARLLRHCLCPSGPAGSPTLGQSLRLARTTHRSGATSSRTAGGWPRRPFAATGTRPCMPAWRTAQSACCSLSAPWTSRGASAGHGAARLRAAQAAG